MLHRIFGSHPQINTLICSLSYDYNPVVHQSGSYIIINFVGK